MYVGITRAMKELYLSRSRCRMLYGQTFHFQPSRFLAEIPSNCFVAKDATGRHAVPDPTPPPGSRRPSMQQSQAEAKAAVAAALDSGLIKRGSNLRPTTQVGDDRTLASDALAPGQRIIHSTFGRGTVAVLRGEPEDRVAIIEFDKYGAKELRLMYAMAKITLA